MFRSMAFAVWIAAFGLCSGFASAGAEQQNDLARFEVELETGAVWQSKNDVEIPNGRGLQHCLVQLCRRLRILPLGPSLTSKCRATKASCPPKVAWALADHGVEVASRVPHVIPPNERYRFYLETKASRSGHWIVSFGKHRIPEQSDRVVVWPVEGDS